MAQGQIRERERGDEFFEFCVMFFYQYRNVRELLCHTSVFHFCVGDCSRITSHGRGFLGDKGNGGPPSS